MKNTTLSADADSVEKARKRTATEHTNMKCTIPNVVGSHVQCEQKSERTIETIRELQASIFSRGRKFSREEVNER